MGLQTLITIQIASIVRPSVCVKDPFFVHSIYSFSKHSNRSRVNNRHFFFTAYVTYGRLERHTILLTLIKFICFYPDFGLYFKQQN